ncbi:NUDIX domain-containing protein [Brachybacterium halotolerans subsp. kimchii]|uniref:NUDIX domain-containing protein n=1 Tax=Brachybacterium halotolerans TaxID=2795215 RepID=UPI001E477087|nr:NUDIX domain-containing protein [Brachybacterium halotolerans]UEJ81476.1 NUDIX domain-containing protein [Brachybacterium halotolerans subsp. kimchii]
MVSEDREVGEDGEDSEGREAGGDGRHGAGRLCWDVDVAIRRAAEPPALAPSRARMLVLSPDVSAIVMVLRTRPGRDPYGVLPGGGLEPDDADPLAGALRELTEETGLGGADVELVTSKVVVEGEQWIFLGRAHRRLPLRLGWPETDRDAEVHGTYEPVWLSPRVALEQLRGGVHPRWITGMIAGGR